MDNPANVVSIKDVLRHRKIAAITESFELWDEELKRVPPQLEYAKAFKGVLLLLAKQFHPQWLEGDYGQSVEVREQQFSAIIDAAEAVLGMPMNYGYP